MLPGDTLSRDGCLAYLMRRNPGLHVGSKTALAWRGVKHNISFRETVSLWGEQSLRLPEWLVSRYPCTYQTTHLFDPSYRRTSVCSRCLLVIHPFLSLFPNALFLNC